MSWCWCWSFVVVNADEFGIGGSNVGGGDVGGGDVGGGCVGASDTGAGGGLGVAVCVLAHKFDIYLICYLARF